MYFWINSDSFPAFNEVIQILVRLSGRKHKDGSSPFTPNIPPFVQITQLNIKVRERLNNYFVHIFPGFPRLVVLQLGLPCLLCLSY